MSVRLCTHAYMAVSFITFFSYPFGSIFYHCIYGYMVCTLLLNFGNYLFLLLCLCIIIALRILIVINVCSVLGMLFHCVVLCIVCV